MHPPLIKLCLILSLLGGLANNSSTSSDKLFSRDLSFLKCELFNARSLCNKLHELKTHITINKPDLLFISETWLTSFTPSSLLVNELNYSIFRRDRPRACRGGGVCILSNNDTVCAASVPMLSKYNDLELVVVDILSSNLPVRLFLCYRAPYSDYDLNAINYTVLMCECIESMLQSNVTSLILGDFNFPRIHWNSNNSLFSSNTCTGVFLDFINKHAYHQFVSEATRLGSIFNTESLLDLIFCNDFNFVHNVKVNDPFSNSDHCVVTFNIINACRKYNQSASYYDFDNADWDSISLYLSNIHFNSVFLNCEDTAKCVDMFYKILFYCIDMYVPFKTFTSKQKTDQNNYPLSVHVHSPYSY